ncbi:MAG: four helix bundle protein [Flavobacteriales bacterium]|nr:four helix bundle protein [Flavobacteriales bacterium]
MEEEKLYDTLVDSTETLNVSDFTENIYNYEDRLVRFAGEVKLWYMRIEKSDVNKYYGHQLLRSSGGAALNYGEAQGTLTPKDFIFKMSLVHKELRECRVNLKILDHGESSNEINVLLEEVSELMAISARMILNAQKKHGHQSKSK